MTQYFEFISNHYMLVFAFVIVLFLLIQDFVTHAFNKFESVSAMIAVTKMNDDSTVVLDVREPHEFIKSHIESAISIPLGKLDEQLPSLEKYKDRPVLVVCQTGGRSVVACKTLHKAGFTNLINMTGGMQSWEDNKFPIKNTSKQKD
jgi:rhodanese-related sulfurtransferase